MYAVTGIISNVNLEVPSKVISYFQDIYPNRFIYNVKHKNFNVTILSLKKIENKRFIFETDDEICFVLCEISNKQEVSKIAQININEINSNEELLFIAYKNVGKKVFEQCYGKWIFIIKNKNNAKIELWRDHIGMCSFYFYIKENSLYFSSHLGTLLQYNNCPKYLNKMLIASLIVGYTGNANETIYKEIYKAPAASFVIITNFSNYEIHRYWQPKTKLIKYNNKTDYLEHFKNILNQIIEENVNNDDVIASTLSSGLDSTFLTSYLANYLQEKKIYAITSVPLKEFKEISTGRRYGNEEPLSEVIVKKYSNIIHLKDDATSISLIDTLHKSLKIHGYPVRNAVNQYWILSLFEKLAINKVNKLFIAQMGNLTISWPYLENTSNTLSKIIKILSIYYPSKKIIKQYEGYFNKNFLKANSLHRYLWKNNYFPYYYSWNNSQKRKYFFEQLLLQGFSSWNEKGIFYGINVIDPFADPRIIEYCFSIPENIFKNNEGTRLFVKSIAKHYVSEEIINNKKKGIQAADVSIRIENEIRKIQQILELSTKSCELNEIFNTTEIYRKAFEKKIKNHVFLRILLITLFYQIATSNEHLRIIEKNKIL